jgi:diaminohydroxyphosphoribosylaminopyrimidine deaminase/5-amino-6-(5-phosphoribosylamino)uracil reductase
MSMACSKRSGDVTDADYMARALFHAARGRGRTSPNPAVGAVIVSPEGVVVGQGYHERAGEPHAEVHALNDAVGQTRGATLYCTLEPCSHTGRTGPCVDRIAEAGITRVVAAMIDPNPLVSGRGFAFLESRGIQVEVGLGVDPAIRLNQPFVTLLRDKRPFVILKAAISLDGGIAATAGQPTALTSAAANRHAHRARAEVDAMAVGVGTILADDPLLTARGVYRERSLMRVIFDRQLRTPPSARVLSTAEAGPVMIVTTPQGAAQADRREPLEALGADIIVGDGTIASALAQLGDRDIASLLIEGGAQVHAAAWDEGVVDFVRLYVTPHVLGRDAVKFLDGREFWSAALHERRTEPIGVDVMIEGYVHGPR